MSELVIDDLSARVGDHQILRGVNLSLRSGEVHAIMGPNGSGKSTLASVVMGRPGYTVTGGAITLDGTDLLGLSPYERAQAGLFLVMQYPTEVPGVKVQDLLEASLEASGRKASQASSLIAAEAKDLEMDDSLLQRAVNVDLSGGEKKRNETLQLAVLRPRFAILDELDSGLDIDALQLASRRIERSTIEDELGVLAITHYNRLLAGLNADVIHVLVNGRIVDHGPPELANEIEAKGYDRWVAMGATEVSVSLGGALAGLARPSTSASEGASDVAAFADPLA